MPASIDLVCIEPARVREIWPHVRPLLEQACRATCLNAFADFEADILSGRSLVWIAWNGSTIEAAAATVLANSDPGKVCAITLCAGRKMPRWLWLIERIEAYARDEGCVRLRIFGRKGWLRVLEGFEAKHVVMDKMVARETEPPKCLSYKCNASPPLQNTPSSLEEGTPPSWADNPRRRKRSNRPPRRGRRRSRI